MKYAKIKCKKCDCSSSTCGIKKKIRGYKTLIIIITERNKDKRNNNNNNNNNNKNNNGLMFSGRWSHLMGRRILFSLSWQSF